MKAIVARLTNVMVLALVALVLVGLMVGVSAQRAAAADPSPQTVSAVETFALYSGTGVTQSGVSLSGLYSMRNYGIADCYTDYIAKGGTFQTATMILQSSADATNWLTDTTFTAMSAVGVSMTRVTVYGYYHRIYATLGNTNPLTITVKCVAKDN
ncbi:MAG: hypothetical protein IPK44_01590 [Candidatus Accumulibacter sp.]|uniref:hypothetical protein n=1 Tax=Accumulibacter sp. TaxID=2053492 RepID=UPI002583D666|nr:hypothetical protein [Accumulibacter sp.]MBK8113293.1 hypothetical protein [Accumulibacter sp.]